MAAELGRFINEQLTRLPADHPDRRFLAALAQTVTAYADREVVPPAVEPSVEAANPAEVSPTPRPHQAAEPGTEQRERVHLVGNVGAAPSFRTTPRGRFIVQFPLGVHEAESTSWYTVLAFDERGKRLREKGLSRGQAVEVIGYPHPRTTRTGTTVAEVYAVTVITHPEAIKKSPDDPT